MNETNLQVGKMAPDFKVEALVGEDFRDIKLSDYRGKWVVLFFYPLDFSFVCPTEVKGFNEYHKQFEEKNAQILGISCDSKYDHRAWTKDVGKLRYPLLSDMTKSVSRAYGVLIEEKGYALRGLFIIDPEGVLKYQVVHDEDVGRSTEEVMRVLSALQSGGMCPMNWKPGQATLQPH